MSATGWTVRLRHAPTGELLSADVMAKGRLIGSATARPDLDAERTAQLFAASQEMLTALKNLLAVENKSWPGYVRQEFAAARAAVAKVEGRPA